MSIFGQKNVKKRNLSDSCVREIADFGFEWTGCAIWGVGRMR